MVRTTGGEPQKGLIFSVVVRHRWTNIEDLKKNERTSNLEKKSGTKATRSGHHDVSIS
jgi:hypothetical protein